jgi:hypothetical protein
MELATLLMQAKRNAYWTVRGYESEGEYIKATFPKSRATYYALINISESLGHMDHELLEDIGRGKCELLAQVKKHSGDLSQEWLDHAKEDDRDTFKRRVKGFLKGEDMKKGNQQEDEFISFRIFGDAINTVHAAFDILAKASGSEKSKSLHLELMCANFLSQFSDDGSGHVMGRNAFILSTVSGLVKQLDFSQKDAADRLIGIIARSVEENEGTKEGK